MLRRPKKKEDAKEESSPSSVEDAVQTMSQQMQEKWNALCDSLEEHDNDKIVWVSKNILRHLTVEAPVIVAYCLLCITIHILNLTVLRGISFQMGVDSEMDPWNLLQYIRFLTHILAHDSIGHLKGNMTNLLLVGPAAEASFGHRVIVQVIVTVAISSAMTHLIVGRYNSRQLGATGVVFAMILLNSLVSAKSGKIPVSFVLTSVLWLGDEAWKLFFSNDGISHSAHLTGGLIGTLYGFRRSEATWNKEESEQTATGYGRFFKLQSVKNKES
jgi:GlpG protein